MSKVLTLNLTPVGTNTYEVYYTSDVELSIIGFIFDTMNADLQNSVVTITTPTDVNPDGASALASFYPTE